MEITTPTLVTAAYLVTALLFILAFAGLSKHETAKHGNYFGMAGMTVAIVSTIGLAIDRDGFQVLGYIVVAMAIGAMVGIWRARRVEMTQMPELIALLHSFVGAAAVLVAYTSFFEADDDPAVKALRGDSDLVFALPIGEGGRSELRRVHATITTAIMATTATATMSRIRFVSTGGPHCVRRCRFDA